MIKPSKKTRRWIIRTKKQGNSKQDIYKVHRTGPCSISTKQLSDLLLQKKVPFAPRTKTLRARSGTPSRSTVNLWSTKAQRKRNETMALQLHTHTQQTKEYMHSPSYATLGGSNVAARVFARKVDTIRLIRASFLFLLCHGSFSDCGRFLPRSSCHGSSNMRSVN